MKIDFEARRLFRQIPVALALLLALPAAGWAVKSEREAAAEEMLAAAREHFGLVLPAPYRFAARLTLSGLAHRGFVAAFSDYVVAQRPTREELRSLVRRWGIRWETRAGYAVVYPDSGDLTSVGTFSSR